ncbi:MAG TPA: N-acetylmuramoyl-L-alanine amidase [bacterium]
MSTTLDGDACRKFFGTAPFFIILLVLFFPSLVLCQSPEWESQLNSRARKLSNDFEYVSLQDVAEVLGAHTYYSNKVRKAILYLGEEKVTVTAHNPFVLVGQAILQMPLETGYDDGDILVPTKYFIPIVRDVLVKTGLLPDSAYPDLAPDVNIAGVTVEEKTNGTLIMIKTRRAFPKNNISTRFSRGWLYVDFLEGKIDQKTFKPEIQNGLVKQIVPLQLEQMVQMSFQLNRNVATKDLTITQQDNEIWITIPNPDKSNSGIIAKLKTDREKWKIDRIVIDPGHGGRDPGTRSRSGVREKDVVLAIAKKLKRLLEKDSDIEVFMTRDNDDYLSLKERTQFANKMGGKLFISIHANWNRNPQVNGATTYFLGLAKSEEASDIAQRENAVISYDASNGNGADYSAEMKILAAMAQNDYNKESQDLAAIIQGTIEKRTQLPDRGVKQAGFYVMVGASMPNVLVETAFLSNNREEKLLKSSSFQQKMAEAIFESIIGFKNKYEKNL